MKINNYFRNLRLELFLFSKKSTYTCTANKVLCNSDNQLNNSLRLADSRIPSICALEAPKSAPLTC